MKTKELERVYFICDSPIQEYQIHKTITGLDLTGIPSKTLNVINSKETGIRIDIKIKDNYENCIADQIKEFQDFLKELELPMTVENMNKVIEHTGFKFDEDFEIPYQIIGMNKEEFLNYYLNHDSKEHDKLKKFCINILKYVVYKQAVYTDYSEYYGDNVFNYFPIFYRLENYNSWQTMLDKMKVDLLDNKSIMSCIDSITIFTPFIIDISSQSYLMFKGSENDLSNLDKLIISDSTIIVKQRYTDESIEDAEFRLNNFDIVAKSNVPKNLLYYIYELDSKPIKYTDDYLIERIKKDNTYEFMYKLLKPIDEDIIIEGQPINIDMIKKIQIFELNNDQETVKPVISWEEIASNPIEVKYEDGSIESYQDDTLVFDNLIIRILPYEHQKLKYDELKYKIKFMTMKEYLESEEFQLEVSDIDKQDSMDYLQNTKYLRVDNEIDKTIPTLKIRVWEDTLAETLRQCTTRAQKVKEIISKRNIETSEQVKDIKPEEISEEIINSLNNVVSNQLKLINVSIIPYTEETLVNDLVKLGLKNPEPTLIFSNIKQTVLNSEKIWKELEILFSNVDIKPDNKSIYMQLIKESCSNILTEIIKLNNDIFKEILNDYVNKKINFSTACASLNKSMIQVCLAAVEE